MARGCCKETLHLILLAGPWPRLAPQKGCRGLGRRSAEGTGSQIRDAEIEFPYRKDALDAGPKLEVCRVSVGSHANSLTSPLPSKKSRSLSPPVSQSRVLAFLPVPVQQWKSLGRHPLLPHDLRVTIQMIQMRSIVSA